MCSEARKEGSEKPEDRELVLRLVDGGASVVGAASGTGIGALLAGLPGAVAGSALGAAIGEILREVGGDVARRLLAPREQQRIGAVIGVAADRVLQRLSDGEQPRADGFIAKGTLSSRSAAAETLEGAILVARSEHEERKIEFLGRLYASLLFDASVDRAQANRLVRLAESLSYSQLCALALYSPRRALISELPDKSYIGALPTPDVVSALAELYELMDKRLLQHSSMVLSSGNTALGPPKVFQEISPSRISLSATGMQSHYLMELEHIPDTDVERLFNILSLDCGVEGESDGLAVDSTDQQREEPPYG